MLISLARSAGGTLNKAAEKLFRSADRTRFRPCNKQTQPHNEIEDHRDFGVPPVVVHHAAGEETCESAQGAQNDAAVDPRVSFEPFPNRQRALEFTRLCCFD